ncbi:hypothetical protein HPX47_001673 [Vibrio alginolyticus]|nr:hypothetical protein [Vibrio alginolyticus]
MQKIYGIPKQLSEFLDYAEKHDLPFEETKDTLESLGCDDFIDDLAKEVANNDATAKLLKDEKMALGKRQSTFENTSKRIREKILLPLLKSMGEKSVKTTHATISLRKTKGKMSIDESQLPDEYFLVEYVRTVNIEKVKLDQANGIDIAGISFEPDKESIAISKHAGKS